MNTQIRDIVNKLAKDITGKDEYIFNPANKTTDDKWAGLLSNGFSFCLEIGPLTFTVKTDKLLVCWKINSSVDLRKIVEVKSNTLVDTIHTGDTTDKICAIVRNGDLDINFFPSKIICYDVIKLGNMDVNVPRAWFNTGTPIEITDNKRDELIAAVLGRPLDTLDKERLIVNIYPPTEQRSKFTFALANTVVNVSINPASVANMNAALRCISDIINTHN